MTSYLPKRTYLSGCINNLSGLLAYIITKYDGIEEAQKRGFPIEIIEQGYTYTYLLRSVNNYGEVWMLLRDFHCEYEHLCGHEHPLSYCLLSLESPPLNGEAPSFYENTL